MRVFLFISLSLISRFALASLNVSDYSNEQICMVAKDPPLPAKIIFEIESRDIICDDGVALKRAEVSFSSDRERFFKLKRWNRMLLGKRPIYSTRSGTNIKIDTFGGEKSITVDKVF